MRDLESAFASPDARRVFVRQLFDTIADRYDLITVLLSYGLDRRWKRRLVEEGRIAPGQTVLDLACGTGDITLGAAGRGARVVGLDITPRMVAIARAKAARRRGDGRWVVPRFLIGDMTAVPLPDGSVDVVTTGYGLRNVPRLEEALDEIARVLRPGGRMVSLDFNHPRSPLVRAAYLTYLTLVGSSLGWLLHGNPDTYRYIPESIRRYPEATGLAALLQDRGFRPVRIRRLLGGLMALHVATKSVK